MFLYGQDVKVGMGLGIKPIFIKTFNTKTNMTSNNKIKKFHKPLGMRLS